MVRSKNQRGESVERMLDYDRFETEDDGWYCINGEEFKEEEVPDVGPWVIESLIVEGACPYCGWPLRRSYYVWGDFPEGDNCIEWTLVHCPNCAFWQFFAKHGLLGDFNARICWEVCIGKARTFTEVLPPGCEQELAQALRRDRNLWASLEPKRLETLVGEILRANYQSCEVIHLGRPYDGGVDVLFVDSGQVEWLVQVKQRFRPSRGEPVETLRNLLGVMFIENKPHGIVVSAADHFTYRAYDLQRRAREKGCVIELLNRGMLNRMLSPLIPERPWSKFYYEHYAHGGKWGENTPTGRGVFRVLNRKIRESLSD